MPLSQSVLAAVLAITGGPAHAVVATVAAKELPVVRSGEASRVRCPEQRVVEVPVSDAPARHPQTSAVVAAGLQAAERDDADRRQATRCP